MSANYIYRGWLVAGKIDAYGHRWLGLRTASGECVILAEAINRDYHSIDGELQNGKWSVRYFTARLAASREELAEQWLQHLCGQAGAYYYEGDRGYSEMTPGSPSEEAFEVGGHNVLEELWSHVGEFLHLEIEFGL